MKYPTLSSESTSAADLLAQYDAARDALNEALAALRKLYPQCRDYPARIDEREARLEYSMRISIVERIRGDIDNLRDDVRRQERERARERANTDTQQDALKAS